MPKKILIVEDNIVILTMQKQIFEMEGYEISTAQEGMDALKKIHEENPDVVLLDVNIPGMNGFELCRQIKEEPTLQNIIGAPPHGKVHKELQCGAAISKVEGINYGTCTLDSCLVYDHVITQYR